MSAKQQQTVYASRPEVGALAVCSSVGFNVKVLGGCVLAALVESRVPHDRLPWTRKLIKDESRCSTDSMTHAIGRIRTDTLCNLDDAQTRNHHEAM
jgi:hypothetical protein